MQVTQTFQKAQELGMTVMRMWAFADGIYQWNALQPAAGILDDDVLRFVWTCAVVSFVERTSLSLDVFLFV